MKRSVAQILLAVGVLVIIAGAEHLFVKTLMSRTWLSSLASLACYSSLVGSTAWCHAKQGHSPYWRCLLDGALAGSAPSAGDDEHLLTKLLSPRGALNTL
jgi:hypothetical protein